MHASEVVYISFSFYYAYPFCSGRKDWVFLFFPIIFISFFVTKLFLEKPFSKNLLRSFSAQFIKRKFEHSDLHQLTFMVILKNPFFLTKTQCRPSQFPREVLSNSDYNTACPYSQFVWSVFCPIRTEYRDFYFVNLCIHSE